MLGVGSSVSLPFEFGLRGMSEQSPCQLRAEVALASNVQQKSCALLSARHWLVSPASKGEPRLTQAGAWSRARVKADGPMCARSWKLRVPVVRSGAANCRRATVCKRFRFFGGAQVLVRYEQDRETPSRPGPGVEQPRPAFPFANPGALDAPSAHLPSSIDSSCPPARGVEFHRARRLQQRRQ